MSARAIIIGAPRSGSGKTSVTIGLLRALKRRGLRAQGAKSGPDYIDPGFHKAATWRDGVNLDSWAMPPALLAALTAEAAGDADAVVIESAMGLFDGIPAEAGRSGSAADLARLFRLPVLLVLDASGQSQTAAAVAKGFASYDPAVRIAGVVLNRLGSERGPEPHHPFPPMDQWAPEDVDAHMTFHRTSTGCSRSAGSTSTLRRSRPATWVRYGGEDAAPSPPTARTRRPATWWQAGT